MDTVRRLFDLGKDSCFLFGPRGTGKSTLVRRRFPRATYIDLLEANTLRLYIARPERLAELVRNLPPASTIIIDEIQKVPQLLGCIHALIEENKRRQFVLTGSSARKLRRTGVDLLAGRALRHILHPFMAVELGTRFDLEKSLTLGMLPLILGARRPAVTLASYIALYLREEVHGEAMVRSLGEFSRFLEVASFSHASVLSVCNLARECEVGRKAVEGYLNVLDDLLLAYRVPVFTRRAQRAMTVHPKFFFADTGMFRSLRPAGPLDRCEEIDGQALEGLVAQHLRAWCDYRGRHALYFWRSRGGVEVDFVVYGDDGLWAIEVKNTAEPRQNDFRGLREFQRDYPAARRLLLYRGREHLLRDGVRCLPVDDFLRALHPARLPVPAAH